MKAIRFYTTGGPDVLKYEDVDVPAPGKGEVQIRHSAIGLNYIDTYHRSGLYPLPLPSGIGLEAAGVVEAVGEGVTNLNKGNRVAYGAGPIGAYAQVRNSPANRVSRLPDAIADETAAAMMLKGMTVRYLLRETYVVKSGDTVLFHAAAGGVGLIAGQWLKALGRYRHRHRRLGGKGRTRPRARLCPCHQLLQRRRGQTRARADRRQGRAGGL